LIANRGWLGSCLSLIRGDESCFEKLPPDWLETIEDGRLYDQVSRATAETAGRLVLPNSRRMLPGSTLK
jgi:hypothetical protein